MKKIYIKPELLIESVQLGQMFAMSISDEPADPDKPTLGRGRRGTWGNLWDEED